ncbi:hypothetical protein AB0E56_00395 [Microbacterium sp. NPDC028030]|uniref:hypothetical protein n=1 Tax=Microbacterium sp. NPDC028030 TaxID=3155124 RepID=UPI0033F9BFCC
MIWLLKARHTFPLTGIVAVSLFAAPLLGDLSIAIPTLRGGVAAGISVTAVIALITPIAIGLSLHTDGRAEYRAAARDLRVIDAATILAYIALSAVAALIAGLLFHTIPAAVVAVRDICGLTGIFLIVASFISWSAAMTAPTLFVFVCALIGRAPTGIETWAWPIALPGSLSAVALSGTLGAIGFAAAVLRPRRE